MAEDDRARRLESAERGLAVMLAVSHALTGWERFEDGSELLLREIAIALGQAAGILWLPEAGMLVPRAFGSPRRGDGVALWGALAALRLAPGRGLPGRAWEQGAPVRHDGDGPQDSALEPTAVAGALRASLALPALAGEEVLGVIELYGAPQEKLGNGLTDVLSAAGRQLGIFFSRRRGELNLSPLTPRELEVLTLMARGLTVRRAAEELSISPATVKTHLEHIYSKLGVCERTSAVAQALRSGLIE
ncbi:MAG: LuxR C-terminal-related transcriptional regulator [Solirubrobacteraceae bacterium]